MSIWTPGSESHFIYIFVCSDFTPFQTKLSFCKVQLYIAQHLAVINQVLKMIGFAS